VQALRAQSDKREYSSWVREYLEATPNLTIYQAAAKSLIFSDEVFDGSEAGLRVTGLRTNLDEEIYADAIVLTAGTFLEGRIFTGNKFESAGRSGEKASIGLSPSIQELGLRTGRLKTGTPPRLDRNTINFAELEEAHGDVGIGLPLSHFSYLPNRPVRVQHPCHITRTNARTHEIIMANLHKSPMYSGEVDAVGPRYCPSIEDKVVRFPHNPSHHFFLEPEGLSTKEIYLQGCSTSLPVDVQWEIVRSLPGLENAEITRPAYAVEYDYFPGIQFKHNFEAKTIAGLFVSGQVLGTSGYEEAAAQGLMAGINAAVYVARHKSSSNERLNSYAREHSSFVIPRAQSYIGTLVDDLVTKEINEPYRMLTSRSEYRLILRQDNADRRLTELGRELGLVDDYRWQVYSEKLETMNREMRYFNNVRVDSSQIVAMIDDPVMAENYKIRGTNKVLLADLLKKPELKASDLKPYLSAGLTEHEIMRLKESDTYIDDIRHGFELETEIKYQGYIEKQTSLIRDMDKYERVKVPVDFDFKNCQQISLEARDKLSRVQPKTLGQASRVGGVSPNDLSVLSIIFETSRRKVNDSHREPRSGVAIH
jgi:tRNA uridine 5-carboxymethylaminomethyl modification enzyme